MRIKQSKLYSRSLISGIAVRSFDLRKNSNKKSISNVFIRNNCVERFYFFTD